MRLILYSRPGCHLCDRLESLIAPHLASLRRAATVEWDKRDIDSDEHWQLYYGDRIPVLELDGRVILEGRPEPAAVAEAFHAITPPQTRP